MDLPDLDNVVRCVSKSKLLKDEDGNIFDKNGKVFGVIPEAFELRESEDELSVNWLEYFNMGNDFENLKEVVKDIRLIRDQKNGAYAIANVGKVRNLAAQKGFKKVKVVHSPVVEPSNLSHASIIRLPRNDGELMLLLSINSIVNIVLNRDIP